MAPETPHPLDTPRESVESLLETAAQRVAARLHEHFPQQQPEEYDALRKRLATIVVSLKRAEAGSFGTPAAGHARVDEALLARLERELLFLPRAQAEAESVLNLLRSCESYRKHRGPSDEAEAAKEEDLRARMMGVDAFELLVEVAHDFRSPLTSILFLSETLRDGHSGEVNELQRSQLGLMYSAAFGLAAVASDVVDLARRGLDLVDEEPTPYGFAELFRSVERMIMPMAEEKGIDLRFCAPTHGQAEGHPHALGRVLLNLTSNALKFTDEGSVEVGVIPLTQGRLEYYVKDTGRGIPSDRQAELFKPFKRRLGQGQNGEFFSGSGVGLSIARRLVEAMGARLEYETSEKEGTRFFFVLPGTRRR